MSSRGLSIKFATEFGLKEISQGIWLLNNKVRSYV